jgi:hypothetical protein
MVTGRTCHQLLGISIIKQTFGQRKLSLYRKVFRYLRNLFLVTLSGELSLEIMRVEKREKKSHRLSHIFSRGYSLLFLDLNIRQLLPASSLPATH